MTCPSRQDWLDNHWMDRQREAEMIEEAKLDAKRLDWLQAKQCQAFTVYGRPSGFNVLDFTYDGNMSLRDAVDAAMKLNP